MEHVRYTLADTLSESVFGSLFGWMQGATVDGGPAHSIFVQRIQCLGQ